MRRLAALAERFGGGEVRLTVWQNMIIPHVADADVPAVQEELVAMGFDWRANAVEGGLVACTGNTGCKFAAANTKGQAVALGRHLAGRVELDRPVNIHLTGCPHSCAQHYVGDIGLQGTPVKVGGETVEGYHLVLGGGVDDERAIGREVFNSVPFDEVPALVEGLLKNYAASCEDDESFAAFSRRHTVDELRSFAASHAHTCD